MGAVLFEQASATVTTSGVAPSTFSMDGLTYIAADLNCTAVAGSGTLDFYIERLGADGIWYTVWHPTQIGGAGATSTGIGPGCSTNAVLTSTGRCRWVIGGTSVTYSASIIGR
jgi:hypothetical protein